MPSLSSHHRRGTRTPDDRRLKIFAAFVLLAFAAVAVRLFVLQVVDHRYYEALAADAHELEKILKPSRGEVFMRDLKNPGTLHPLAINEDRFTVYAEPKKIDDPEQTARIVADLLGLEGEGRMTLLRKLQKRDDPHETLARTVDEETVERIKEKKFAGIGFTREPFRFYPEKSMGGHVIGFLGFGDAGREGRYGIEGHFEKALKGKSGYLKGERAAKGGVLTFGPREVIPAEHGARVILTIDKTIQAHLCDALRRGLEEHKAASATAIVQDPRTGEILAMCSVPDFDPNKYNKVEDQNVFKNPAAFIAYEPGSVFKAITMAAALDQEKVTPETRYVDKGFLTLNDRTIKNAAEKVYGEQTMIGVLVNSINTGAVFAVQQIGRETFKKYAQAFGFGEKTGIALDHEAAGTIANLDKKGEIFTATAAFGQGITATPIQLVSAFAAIANGGKRMEPQVISEIRWGDGRVERTSPKEVSAPISPRAARILSGMLAAVVRDGSAKRAQVPGYFVAGKTGTAQIASPTGGYLEDTIHTFVGFAPVDDPRFAILVKYEKPQRRFAESTAVPTAGEIAKFILRYLEVSPDEVR